MELVKLRQQQQTTKACIQLMEQRLRNSETKQQQMTRFLARAMLNPNFVQQLVQQKNMRTELEEAMNKKRRRPIDQGPSDADADHEYVQEEGIGTFVKVEQQESAGNLPDDEIEVPKMDELGLDNEELYRRQQNFVECIEEGDEHVDDGLWEDILNEDFGDEMGMLDGKCEDEEDVNVLVKQLGYLGSGPN